MTEKVGQTLIKRGELELAHARKKLLVRSRLAELSVCPGGVKLNRAFIKITMPLKRWTIRAERTE
jgi:hypothetical protein